MKTYLLKILLTVLAIVGCHFLVLFTVRGPLPAEYWVREFIIMKRHQGEVLKSPKIIFVGGSATLFGIDAAAVQKSLGIPTLNFGTHAGIRLEDHLDDARAVAKPGDVVVLALEPAYFDYYSTAWDGWNLRNELAWNSSRLDSLPWWRRGQIFAQGSDLTLSWDLVNAAIAQRVNPASVARRVQALGTEQAILDRFAAEGGTSKTFRYDLSNVDASGDLLQTSSDGLLRRGDVVATTRPAAISPYAENLLVPFLAEMKARNVRVFFEYTPYLVYETPGKEWKEAAAHFEGELHRLGGEMLEERGAFFYPSTYFYNSNLHMNERGRNARTPLLIEALREKLKSGTPP